MRKISLIALAAIAVLVVCWIFHVPYVGSFARWLFTIALPWALVVILLIAFLLFLFFNGIRARRAKARRKGEEANDTRREPAAALKPQPAKAEKKDDSDHSTHGHNDHDAQGHGHGGKSGVLAGIADVLRSLFPIVVAGCLIAAFFAWVGLQNNFLTMPNHVWTVVKSSVAPAPATAVTGTPVPSVPCTNDWFQVTDDSRATSIDGGYHVRSEDNCVTQVSAFADGYSPTEDDDLDKEGFEKVHNDSIGGEDVHISDLNGKVLWARNVTVDIADRHH